MKVSVSYLMRFFVLFVIYILTCKLSLWIQSTTGMGTQIWPAAGIALAAILIWGSSICPAIFLGTLAVHWLNGDSIAGFIGPALGNTLEPLIGAVISSFGTNFKNTLDRPKYIVWFLAGSTLAATLVGALVGVTLLGLSGFRVDFFYFIQYWSGDSLGILMITPLILAFAVPVNNSFLKLQNLKQLEFLWLAIIIVCTIVLFFIVDKGPVQLCFFFPLVMWAALHFGQRGVTLLTLLVSAFMILITAHGYGPFKEFESRTQGELFLFLFVATLQITGLIVASIVLQREEAHHRLQDVNNELVKVLKAREDFLIVASHELRTPLTPLRMYFDLFKGALLKSEQKDSNYQVILKNFLQCESSLKRMILLTDELLEVAHLRHGQLTLNLEEVNLTELIQEVLKHLEDSFIQKQCTVNLQIASEIIGNWDCIKIQKVITKLLTNAVKYSLNRPIEIWVSKDEVSATLVITDHGMGISLEDQSKIFECFERRSDHYDGSGMGLFIARKYIEAHHGVIKVESELGKGARFTVELPLYLKS